jgi:hypothetical protein
MADQTLSADRPSESVCPWCSATIVPGSPTCASCGASLESEEDRDVPGLTAVDMAILRGEKKEQPAPSRNRLLSWISGDYTVEPAPLTQTESQALAPPDPEVQREIIRLELEAEVANLQAEADSLLSEAVVDGRVSELPADVQELATGEFDAETLAAATTDEDGLPVAPATGEGAPASADVETVPDAETAPDDEPAADDKVPPA